MYRPLRGQTPSHRVTTTLEASGVPVGAGLPAKRPAQVIDIACSYMDHRLRDMAARGLPV
ncbi:hypothetical protein E8E78_19150 [Pseudomonas sp. BN505]|nr:hypothetical protein [Pseudomonas sp. BN605]MDH4858688.1 hypothetical protein [Pseudomonas sp. BN505]NTY94426.1 hypothetical protein [Pseudomonas putida]NTZ02551.1 hypothetical protein [Pseudomonas putida]NTZ23765.1 hypothetical protein [Pseudomonas putida]